MHRNQLQRMERQRTPQSLSDGTLVRHREHGIGVILWQDTDAYHVLIDSSDMIKIIDKRECEEEE